MIYTRFGQTVTIIANAGKHSIPNLDSPFTYTLVQVRATNAPEWKRWRFAATLRSDGDPNEIDNAVKAAPFVTLEPKELKNARWEAS